MTPGKRRKIAQHSNAQGKNVLKRQLSQAVLSALGFGHEENGG